MRTVALCLLAFAMIAVSRALVPETEFLEGINGEQGSISGAPMSPNGDSVDKTLDQLNKEGAVGASLYGASQHAGTTDRHSNVVCENPTDVVCPSGICAAVCPKEKLTDQGNGGGFHTEFQPEEHVYAKAPNVQGTAKQFTKLATNHAQEKTRITNLAIQNAEEAAGLSGASDHEANQMKTQKLAAQKQAVDQAMNEAAAAAAAYKAADAAHTAATVAVAKQVTAEKAQEQIVAEAKETLEHEKVKLAAVKVELRKKREAKANAMYHAETTAGEYQTLRAHAIRVDNQLQEQIRQEKEKVKYREVAEKAVEKQAAADLKAQEEQAAKDMAGQGSQSTPAVPPATEGSVATAAENGSHLATAKSAAEKVPATTGANQPVCADCQDKVVNGKTISGLPEVYAKAEGFCSDCAEWKQAGQCDDAKYKTFMAHYCQKSCGCRDVKGGSATSTAPVELHQMPTVKGLLP